MTRQFLARIAKGGSPAFAVLLTISTQGFVVALNVATGVITARLLGANGRGEFTAATIWPQFLAGVAGFGLPAAIVFYIRTYPEKRREITGSAYILTAVAATIATAIGLVVAPLLMANAEAQTIRLAQFCILWTCTNVFTVTLRQVALAEGAFRLFSTSSYVPPFSYLTALLIVWPLLGLTPASASTCLMVSSLIGLLWTFGLVHKRVVARFMDSARWMWQLVGYALRLAPSDISGSLLTYLDRLVLIPFLSPAGLGLYVVAYSLSRLMFVLQVAVTSVLYPSMTGRPPAEAKALHDLAFRLILFAGGAGVGTTFLLAPVALRYVYGPEFVAAGLLLRILMTEAALSCLAQVTINLYLSLKWPGAVSWIQMICLGAATALLLLLVPRFGAVGAAAALLLVALLRLGLLLGGIAAFFQMRLPGLIPTTADFRYIWMKLS